MAVKPLQKWLEEYGESHRNDTNKRIHYLCVPVIFWSICGLLFSVKLPFDSNGYQLSMAEPVLLLVVLYYLRLSLTLLPGILLFSVICLWTGRAIEQGTGQLPVICASAFVIAWIGQFYGHHIEGKRPSFLKDLRFLLIGPAWIMAQLYKKSGLA